MSMMQGFRDGYRVNWKRLAAWAWIYTVVGTLLAAFWVSLGWKSFAAISAMGAFVLVTAWAYATIVDR